MDVNEAADLEAEEEGRETPLGAGGWVATDGGELLLYSDALLLAMFALMSLYWFFLRGTTPFAYAGNRK